MSASKIEAEITRRWNSTEYNPTGTILRESLRPGVLHDLGYGQQEYVASIRQCVQISPDDWDTQTRTLHVTDSTTIKEVADWYREQTRGRIIIQITELEKQQ